MIDQTHSWWPSLPSSKCLGKEVRVNNRQEAFNGLGFLPLAKSKQDSRTCYTSNRGEWQELAMDGTYPPTIGTKHVQISLRCILVTPAAIQLCLIGRQAREDSTHNGNGLMNRERRERRVLSSHQKRVDTEASQGKAC